MNLRLLSKENIYKFMSQTRQLAAIMFTDIVAYSALMGYNEQKALSILNKNSDLLKLIIEKNNQLCCRQDLRIQGNYHFIQ